MGQDGSRSEGRWVERPGEIVTRVRAVALSSQVTANPPDTGSGDRVRKDADVGRVSL